MSDDAVSNRRVFLRNLLKSAVGCAVVSGSVHRIYAQDERPSPARRRGPRPARTRNLRVVAGPDPAPAKALIARSDLGWQGMCHAPDGGFSYNEGQVAVRYVGGERRLLMVKWHQKDATNGWAGNLVELRPPALAQTTDASQAMTVVREWARWHWVPTGSLLTSLSNGWEVGGLWWDESQQVVWYTLYPYYGPGVAMPFLGATRLNDNGTVSRYGPWYYVSPTTDSFRKVCYWFVPIPASAQADCGGRRMAIGATAMGASGGSPTNWGPGLTALRLPDLASSGPVEAGLPLMDYSPGAGGLAHPWFHCRREPDYASINSPQSGAIPAPIGREGFWQASADNATGVAWIETKTKHGLILIGQRVSHASWYGFPDSKNDLVSGVTVHASLPSAIGVDTMMPSQGSTGYHSDGWQSAFWRFDPAQIREVGRGQRKASADGMRPTLLGQWHLQWTEIPRPLNHPYVYSGHGTAVLDNATNQLVWVQARSKLLGHAVLPTVHVFSLPE